MAGVESLDRLYGGEEFQIQYTVNTPNCRLVPVSLFMYGRGLKEITATPLVLPSLDEEIYGANVPKFDA